MKEALILKLHEKETKDKFIDTLKKDIGNNISAISFSKDFKELAGDMGDELSGESNFWETEKYKKENNISDDNYY